MNNLLNNHDNMSHDNNGSTSPEIILFGFILALGNHVFNWFGHIFGQVHPPSLWGAMVQALITGALGATAAFFTNKLWKYITTKKSKNDDKK